ncbi:SRPBCC family protein [Glutamicibacter sp.]|uniref:SRPBCC family protein n=1 Tax=Glutamicibacter sp. TaxID=1931995 RepID=UPI0028BDD5A5|nr:SRPBCC family protein [Glutamicibacter sp.]
MSQFSVFESTETVHLPVHRVWELLTDWTSAPLWMPGVETMHADDPQLRVGTNLVYRISGHERRYEVHDLIEDKLLVLHTSQNPDGLSYRYDLKDDAGQTEVVLQVSIINPDLSVAECEELAQAVTADEGEILARLRSYAQLAP